jgi:hypothetical protein
VREVLESAWEFLWLGRIGILDPMDGGPKSSGNRNKIIGVPELFFSDRLLPLSREGVANARPIPDGWYCPLICPAKMGESEPSDIPEPTIT